jgi:hypothetical protein
MGPELDLRVGVRGPGDEELEHLPLPKLPKRAAAPRRRGIAMEGRLHIDDKVVPLDLEGDPRHLIRSGFVPIPRTRDF